MQLNGSICQLWGKSTGIGVIHHRVTTVGLSPQALRCSVFGVLREKQVIAVVVHRGHKASVMSMLGSPDCSTCERHPGTDVGVGGGRRFSDVQMPGEGTRDD